MDEQKKKMLMIGGVVALAVIVIIAAAVMMNHKKKVEQSPMIVHTTTGPIIVPANTPVSTLPTTGATTIPSTTRAATTQGVTTTIPVTTRAVTTVPIQKKNYIRSFDGNYLILEKGYKISSTPNYTQATPIVLGTVTYGDQEFYPLMTESGKYISMTNNNVNYTDDIENDVDIATTLVLVSKTYPTDLYLWGTGSNLQPSLVLGPDSNKSFSVVYV
jgi:hypothetical protein